ncbi:hypothetical protein [Undibacterium umbellatum]|uniref:Uncharacterized protein n=1 Tax=Undibacterium umbellatum TaxID=2762300 RepID=A0ABR6ZD69_9BURK|nr:hypothetical protein [Undibacterium umbellatum]MBC3909658.1 hypothetical protein [Undibacterium umbellatum]
MCTWLADPRLLDAFFAQHDFAALPALDAQGQIIVLAADELPPTSASLFFRHWQAPVQALPVLSDGFRRYFLWQLRASSAHQQLAWLQIWHRHLSMYAEAAYRAENLGLLARLCALNPSQCHAAELAQLLPATRENIFLRVLIREAQGQLSAQQMSAGQLMRLHGLSEYEARFEHYLGSVLRNLGRQVSVEYTLDGCLLFETSGVADLRDCYLDIGQDCKEELVDIITLVCDCAGIRMQTSLWRNCGELPGLTQLLRETCWSALTAQTADNLINVIFQFRWLDDDADRLAKWRAYLRIYPNFHAMLIQLEGGSQEKFSLLWYKLIDSLDDAAGMCATVIDALPVMHMLSQAPYANEIDYGYALPNLISYLPAHLRRALPSLGGHFWRTFERACRREK